MALDLFKAEFQLFKLFYTFHDDRVFFCNHWKLPHVVHVVCRGLLSFYTIFGFIHYFVTDSPVPRLFIFFTTWSYIALTIHLALAALLSLIFYGKAHHGRIFPRKAPTTSSASVNSNAIEIPQRSSIKTAPYTNGHGNASQNSLHNYESNAHLHTGSGNDVDEAKNRGETSWYFKISWCLSIINGCAAPIVTSIYFTAIYPNLEGGVGFVDINVHILNTVFVLIDFILSSRPERLLHIPAPVVYGLGWLIFSIIYWSMDHQNHVVYEIIDWNKPGITTGWAIGLLVLLFVLKTVYFLLHRLKIWLYTTIHEEEYFIEDDF